MKSQLQYSCIIYSLQCHAVLYLHFFTLLLALYLSRVAVLALPLTQPLLERRTASSQPPRLKFSSFEILFICSNLIDFINCISMAQINKTKSLSTESVPTDFFFLIGEGG